MNKKYKVEEYKAPAIKVITVNLKQVLCLSNPESYNTDTNPEKDVF